MIAPNQNINQNQNQNFVPALYPSVPATTTMTGNDFVLPVLLIIALILLLK